MDTAIAERRRINPWQVLAFTLVGGTTALIYVGGYSVFRQSGVPAAAASTLSYLAAITFQYFGHSGLTFGKNPRDRGQLVRFLVLNGIGLITAVAITLALTKILGAQDWVASLAVILVLPVLNWFLMRLWVFV